MKADKEKLTNINLEDIKTISDYRKTLENRLRNTTDCGLKSYYEAQIVAVSNVVKILINNTKNKK